MNRHRVKFEVGKESQNVYSTEALRDYPARIYLKAQAEYLKSRTIFWFMLFLSLNLLDTILTNKACAMLESVGLDGKAAEANLLLQPLTGSWLFMLKGMFVLVLMMLADRFLRIPIRRTMTWSCFILVVICLWNAKSIGLL